MDVDTIVAEATAPGMGAVALIRMSGSKAVDILRRVLLPGVPLPEPRLASVREIVDPEDGESLDRVVVVRFSSPASYTGEDVVELSCHGGWITPRLLLDACVRAGAREAEPGEFTRRAYLNGKVDLVQAEAVADLVEARSTAMRSAALGQLERGLSQRVGELRDRLIQVEALLAHHVDFPEEDEAPASLDEVGEASRRLEDDLSRMLATAPEGALLREGALAVFAGRPNVGKSALYNALLGEERAIVTPDAGTTRDALEAAVQLGGFPFRLVDTAGLREDAGRIEALGIEVARGYLARADVILYCVEAGTSGARDVVEVLGDHGDKPVVWVETKADRGVGREDRDGLPGVAGFVRVSARTGAGLDELRALLPTLVYRSLVSARWEDPVLTRRRQARALGRAREEVVAFRRALAEGVPAEMAATHLRGAEEALEAVLGIVSTEDVLDRVFRDFCIGK